MPLHRMSIGLQFQVISDFSAWECLIMHCGVEHMISLHVIINISKCIALDV